MTPEVGTFQNPVVTWNLYLTLGGGVVLGLMIKYWFSVMNKKAEDRLKNFSDQMQLILGTLISDVKCKQDKELCDQIHVTEDERHKEMKCDIKEIKAMVNTVYKNLAGFKNGF